MKSAVIALIFLSFANGAMAQQKIENIFKTSNNIGSSKTFQLTEEARSIYQKRSIQDEVVSTSTVARSRPFTRAFIDYHLKPTYDQRSGELVAISGSIPKLKNHTSHKQRYINYLETVKEVLFLTDPSKEVIKKQSQMDQEGRMHTRLNQIVKGVRVYGSELLVHEKNESIYLLQGNTIKVDRDINIHPEVNREKAISIAKGSVKNYQPIKGNLKSLFTKEQVVAELIIYPFKKKQYLALGN